MRYCPKSRTKTVIMSLETKPKKFLCIEILRSVELKRQKTFLPSNIINILTDLFEDVFSLFLLQTRVRFYIDYLDKIVLVFIALYHIVIL